MDIKIRLPGAPTWYCNWRFGKDHEERLKLTGQISQSRSWDFGLFGFGFTEIIISNDEEQ